MASDTIVLYFIGTNYKSSSPIFTVRGTVYQPKGLGSAIEVRGVDAQSLITKAITYGGDGRAYQGFTRDPNLAAAVRQSKEPIAVDATLAEQARAAIKVGDRVAILKDLLGNADVNEDDLLKFLENQKSGTLPSKEDEDDSETKSKSTRSKKTTSSTSKDTKEE